MRKILSIFAAMLVAVAVSADPVVLPATLDVNNVGFRSEGMPDFVVEEGDYAGTYFDMGAHNNANDTLLYAEWDVTIEPLLYNISVDVYNTNSWRVQLYLLNQAGDTLKGLRYKGSSGQCGHYAIGAIDMRDLEAGNYKVRAHAATAWSAMKLKDVIFEANYAGAPVSLPGTLLPAYAELSSGASINADGAIVFAPSTANNEYATWNVNFTEAGDFNVSIDLTGSNCHDYSVALLSADGQTSIVAVAEGGCHEDTGAKELGAITVPAAGSYIVKLTNATQWSNAVLNSITFASNTPAAKYYMKNSWGDEDPNNWTVKEMEWVSGTIFKLDNVVFGGQGVNHSDDPTFQSGSWLPVETFLGDKPERFDTVNIVFDRSNYELTCTIIGKYMPYMAIIGDMNGWAGDELVWAEDRQTASVTINLAMNEGSGYGFKVLIADKAYCIAPDEHGWYAFHRGWTSASNIDHEATSEEAFWLQIDKAGDYTFMWTRAEKKLDITFPDLETITVYYVNTTNWENVYAYAWSPEVATWPGEQMTLTEQTTCGYAIYSYVVEENRTGIVFNDGTGGAGHQTDDLSLADAKDGRPYFYKSQWYASLEEIPTAITNINAASQVEKMIENGQLLIIKNGVKYNAQGTMVK